MMTDEAVQPTPSILMVDDEPLLLRGYARLLRTAGYQVTTACDGEEAAGRARFVAVFGDLRQESTNARRSVPQ